MHIILWIMLGILGGVAATMTLNVQRSDMRKNIALGIIGALDGGSMLHLFFGDLAAQTHYIDAVLAMLGTVFLIVLARHLRSFQ
jgi:uncharacterized membrane protein YeaQ/YmgE (transglycosylase-associated protein family)